MKPTNSLTPRSERKDTKRPRAKPVLIRKSSVFSHGTGYGIINLVYVGTK